MSDTINRLKELKEMLDSGLITQTEFDDLKAKELGLNKDSIGSSLGQQSDSVFVNQGVVNGNKQGKKRGKGCLVVFLILGVITIGFIILTNTLVGKHAEKEIEIQKEQEQVDALEQIVDVNKYYFMPEEEVIALHGEPDKIREVSESSKSFTYDEGFTTTFENGKCYIYIYRQQFEIEKMEDAFVLFGIEPNESTIEGGWSDIMNDYFIQNVNEKVKSIIIKVNKTNAKQGEKFSVFFK